MTTSVSDMAGWQDAGDAEEALLAAADRMAHAYVAGCGERRPFPDAGALAGLAAFDEALPTAGRDGAETLALLDRAGSPATVASNGPNYYGFVIGASLPVAAAADRLVLAWDQSAALSDSSPAAAAIEKVAARWLLDILDLPRGSGVGLPSQRAWSLVVMPPSEQPSASAGPVLFSRVVMPLRLLSNDAPHRRNLGTLRPHDHAVDHGGSAIPPGHIRHRLQHGVEYTALDPAPVATDYAAPLAIFVRQLAPLRARPRHPHHALKEKPVVACRSAAPPALRR